MNLLEFITRPLRRRLLALGHSALGHADLTVDPRTGRIHCDSCRTVLSPGRSV